MKSITNLFSELFYNLEKSLFYVYLKIFMFVGLIYMSMEVIFRALLGKMLGFNGCNYFSLMGFSSLWMIPIGGLCIAISTSIYNRVYIRSWINLLISMAIIWFIEFVSGYIFNIKCGLHLWDYSTIPLNVMGQITFCYAPIWCILTPIGWYLFDTICCVEGKKTYLPKKLYQYYIDIVTGK